MHVCADIVVGFVDFDGFVAKHAAVGDDNDKRGFVTDGDKLDFAHLHVLEVFHDDDGRIIRDVGNDFRGFFDNVFDAVHSFAEFIFNKRNFVFGKTFSVHDLIDVKLVSLRQRYAPRRYVRLDEISHLFKRGKLVSYRGA